MNEADYMPSSAKEARSLGLKHYFNGNPCRNGHIVQRYAIDSGCAECKLIASKARAERAKVDPDLAETMRGWHREAKRKARATDAGKQAHYEANKRYTAKNRGKVNEYYRSRAKADPVFRMQRSARSMLSKVMLRANRRKDSRCVDLLGYTGKELKEHIERQFLNGMSWDLFGEQIHIDHIIPVAEMLRRGITDPAIINALSNLRPMWAEDNMRKRDAVLTLL